VRYFVNDYSRLVRTTDDVAGVPPKPWREVTSSGYDQFRLNTRTLLTAKELRVIQSTGEGKVTTMKGLKRAATKRKKAAQAAGEKMTHTEALEKEAWARGYQGFEHAQKELESD
jgi:hypothetical protein